MAKINFDKNVYEGWTVRDFIEELEPLLDMIQTGNSCYRPMKTRAEIRNWTADNQPYYKKPVADVVNYFCNRYNIS